MPRAKVGGARMFDLLIVTNSDHSFFMINHFCSVDGSRISRQNMLEFGRFLEPCRHLDSLEVSS